MSVQLENGYIRIANEIWDEIIRRDFSKRQKDILHLILRLSYGCQKKVAHIPMLKDFALCGVTPNHISNEIAYLRDCKVIEWERDDMLFAFNKNYDVWQMSPVRGWNTERFKELVHINLHDSTSQNRNFPKQELPEKGSMDFPKREVDEPEIPCGSKGEGLPKDSIKDIKRYIVPDEKIIFDHWNTKKIVVHRELTEMMKSHIHARLQSRTADEITQAIDNYQEIVTGDIYFFSYKWGLNDFMNPKNLDKFLEENEPRRNFLKDKLLKPKPIIRYDDPTPEEEERSARAAQRQQERNLGKTGTDRSY